MSKLPNLHLLQYHIPTAPPISQSFNFAIFLQSSKYIYLQILHIPLHQNPHISQYIFFSNHTILHFFLSCILHILLSQNPKYHNPPPLLFLQYSNSSYITIFISSNLTILQFPLSSNPPSPLHSKPLISFVIIFHYIFHSHNPYILRSHNPLSPPSPPISQS